MAKPADTARLDAQLARLRSDEHLRARVRATARLSAAQRLELTRALCRAGADMLDQLPPAVRARREAWREPLGPNAAALLRRLATIPRP